MEFALDLLVTLLSAATVAQYAWSMRAHFHSSTMPAGAAVISIAVVLIALILVLLLWGNPQPAGAKLAGIFMELAGAALFWWAIAASRRAHLRFVFDAERPDSIVMRGPYRYLRHPFYLSYLIFWTGWGLAVWSPWAIGPVLVIAALYVKAALVEEAKFAESPLAGDYAAYSQRAGFFWPRFGARTG